jgi:uncharacterized protein (TIGR02757 family)
MILSTLQEMKKRLSRTELRDFLELKVEEYNRPEFIDDDPISIPHAFRKSQDIEISGFFAATLAWGQRGTIIRKCKELMAMMDNAPYDFVRNHTDNDLKPILTFKHRTFNPTDTLYFIAFFKDYYRNKKSLQELFALEPSANNVEMALINFHKRFFSLEHFPERTRKHVPTPERKSTCKRLNMYLRWMVRRDAKGVDFGIWNSLKPSQLICPCDLHVDRVGRLLGLIKREKTDWLTALELTDNLRRFDPSDPVKYDFALFSLGVEGLGKLKG